jgi:hypothetical protein
MQEGQRFVVLDRPDAEWVHVERLSDKVRAHTSFRASWAPLLLAHTTTLHAVLLRTHNLISYCAASHTQHRGRPSLSTTLQNVLSSALLPVRLCAFDDLL